MQTERQKAVALTTTSRQQRKLVKSYKQPKCLSSTIDELLAGLLFGLQLQHFSPLECATVLDSIDRLIRLKVDCGLIRRKRNAS